MGRADRCEDSLLAAPIILDLILVTELFGRIKVCGSGSDCVRAREAVQRRWGVSVGGITAASLGASVDDELELANTCHRCAARARLILSASTLFCRFSASSSRRRWYRRARL